MLTYLKQFDRRLWVLAIGWIASSVGFSISIPFLSLYFHSTLGMSLTHIGLFFGFTAIIRSVFQSIGGELSDRFGRYHQMVYSQIIRSISFLVLAYAIYGDWGFRAIAVLIIFNSVFGALFQPAANATVADLVGMDKRTEGYSIIRVAGNFGWALGPALGGFFAEQTYAVLFIISGGMTLISSIIIALFLKGIKMDYISNDKFQFGHIFQFKGYELIVHHALLVFILYLVVSQFIAPFSLYSVDFMGITKKQLGFLFTLNGLMVTFLQLPITRLLRSVRLSIQMLLGSVIYAVAYIIIGATATFMAFAIGIAVLTIGENFISPPALAITANLAPPGRIGRFMGIYGFSVTAGWSLGPLLGGLLLDLAKPDFIYSWGFVSILALVAAAGFGNLTRRIPKSLNLRQPHQ
nr:MFS transporter [candidate division Zixibacteria bacterium]